MLSETAKTFLRYNFSPDENDDPEQDETMEMVRRHGRKAIEQAVRIFVASYSEDIDAPAMKETADNIQLNFEEAVQYAAGVLGMC